MKPFELLVASDIPAALDAGAKGYHYKAGGVDLTDRLKERIAAPDKLVSVAGVKALGAIYQDPKGLHIGPGATLSEVAGNPIVKASFPALAHAAGEAATPQIRNMATFGGNLCQRPRCWYFRSQHFHCLKKGGSTCFAVDGEHETHALYGGGPCHIVHPSNVAPPLLAADAVLKLQHKTRGKRQMRAEEFFVVPARSLMAENQLHAGELIVEVTVPRPPKRSGYAEVRHKQSFDWPLAAAAVAQMPDGAWRVALGAVAPVPWRSRPAEAVLARAAGLPGKAVIDAAAKAALQGAKPLPRAKWRLELVTAVVRRALQDALGGE